MILGANKQQSQDKDGNFGTSHGEKTLRPGNHLLAELCVRARVFSSQDAKSGVLEISAVYLITAKLSKCCGLVSLATYVHVAELSKQWCDHLAKYTLCIHQHVCIINKIDGMLLHKINRKHLLAYDSNITKLRDFFCNFGKGP